MKHKILWVNTYKYTEIICNEGEQEHPERNERDRAYYFIDVLYTTGAMKTYCINWDKTKCWSNVPKEVSRWIQGSATLNYKQNASKTIKNGKATYRIQTKYQQY